MGFIIGVVVGAVAVLLYVKAIAEPTYWEKRKEGFLDGWFARHRGKDLLPRVQEESGFWETRVFDGEFGTYKFADTLTIRSYVMANKFEPYLSKSERRLLKDPAERKHRNVDRLSSFEGTCSDEENELSDT